MARGRTGEPTKGEELHAAVAARHPRFAEAVAADLAIARMRRGEDAPLRSRAAVVREVLRLSVEMDAFGALVAYRAKAACRRRGIPVLPLVLHRIAIAWAGISIGDPVLVHPGVFFAHGSVVIDGFVEVHPGVRFRPFVTIGLKERNLFGPTIGRDVKLGTGAKVIGPVTIGDGAVIGANAVVLDDVPAGATAAGVPARVLS
ncbi:MAG: hypothetical protein R2702_07360 [Acidimicrobiales bacterium]